MSYELSALSLRRWRIAETRFLFKFHQDPLMRTQAVFDSLDAAQAWINWANALDSGQVFAIADARDRPIGSIGITNFDQHETGWTWYATIADVRGKGVASDALRAVAGWAHEQGLHRLELGHRLDNPGSCKVATRAGFLPEGIERERLSHDGERFDVERHARLASDPLPEPGRPVTVLP